MNLNTTRGGDGATTFHLSDRLTFKDYDAFGEILKDVAMGADQSFVFDLGNLSFIDSFGIGMLLVAVDEASKAHNTLVFANPTGDVRRVFELADLNSVLDVRKPATSRPAQENRLSFHEAGGAISLFGRFTFADQEEFERLLSTILAKHERLIVLDLAQLEFMDSAGLSMMLIVREEAEKKGIRISLANPRGRVRKLLELAALDAVVDIHGPS